MSYTLRQAKPLLNATELDLFTASSRTGISSLTPRELRSKITRSRTLRDKYRDLYQRQTVAVQRGAQARRQPTGGENERTLKKGEIFAEVLQRFEAQLPKAEARADTKKPAKGSTATAKKKAAASNQKTTQTPAAAKTKKATPAKAVKAAKAAKPAKAVKPEKTGKAGKAAKSVAATPSKKSKAAKAEKAAKPAKATQTAQAAKTKAVATTIPGLKKAATRAVAKKQAEAASEGKRGAGKKVQPEISSAPSAAARGAVPATRSARADRLHTLKEKPVNQKIHASAKGRGARQQAKKDGR